jgi:DNA-binding transcriptional LysR family regulator
MLQQPHDTSRLKRRLKLRDLDTLLGVVRAGGMRKAAGQLHMSQAAVSKAIAELEDALGVVLLDRSRQGVQVTPAGRALIQRAESMFGELAQGVLELQHLADPDGGNVNLACSEPIMGGLIATAMERMARSHPRVNFVVESGGTPAQQVQALQDGQCDFVIARPQSLALGAEIAVEPLFRDRIDAVVGQASPFARRRKLTLAELVDARWIISPIETRVDSPVIAAFGNAGLPLPRWWVSSGSLNARHTLLAGGGYVTAMPHSFVHFAGRHHALKVLPVQLGQWQAPTVLMTLRHHTLGPAVRAFIEVVRELAGPLGD